MAGPAATRETAKIAVALTPISVYLGGSAPAAAIARSQLPNRLTTVAFAG